MKTLIILILFIQIAGCAGVDKKESSPSDTPVQTPAVNEPSNLENTDEQEFSPDSAADTGPVVIDKSDNENSAIGVTGNGNAANMGSVNIGKSVIKGRVINRSNVKNSANIAIAKGHNASMGSIVIGAPKPNGETGSNSDIKNDVNIAVDKGSTADPGFTEPVELNAVDRILERMKSGNIVFNVPGTLNLHETVIIQLVLGVEKKVEELNKLLEQEGKKVSAKIRISDRMEARLSGSNFEITSISQEVQAVSRREPTEWKWEIKPKSKGKQYLHLTLSALISVEGKTTPRVIRTFDKIIIVEVTRTQQMKSFVKNNWQWVWTAALLPLAAWIWERRKRLLNKDRGSG